jgi:hypothetical protein
MPRHNKTIPHTPFAPKGGHAGKRQFRSKSEAETAIKERLREEPEVDFRAYRCLECFGWHLTSNSAKK